MYKGFYGTTLEGEEWSASSDRTVPLVMTMAFSLSLWKPHRFPLYGRTVHWSKKCSRQKAGYSLEPRTTLGFTQVRNSQGSHTAAILFLKQKQKPFCCFVFCFPKTHRCCAEITGQARGEEVRERGLNEWSALCSYLQSPLSSLQ